MKVRHVAVSLLAVGFLAAQQPAPAPRGHFGRGPGGPPQTFEQRLTERLSLTAEQQNKVHTAMLESRVLGQGLQQQMQTAHQALTAAIKAGNEDQIEKASQDIAAIHQQQTSIQAKTMAKIYSSLTADQKTKVGSNLELLMGGLSPRRGMAPPPAGAPNAPKPQQN